MPDQSSEKPNASGAPSRILEISDTLAKSAFLLYQDLRAGWAPGPAGPAGVPPGQHRNRICGATGCQIAECHDPMLHYLQRDGHEPGHGGGLRCAEDPSALPRPMRSIRV